MRSSRAALLSTVLLAATPALAVDYVRDVQPILRQHCYSCHGGLRAKSGLRLDHLSFMRQGGDGGSALAATSAESRLIQAVTGEGDIERMPLEAKPLSDEQIATLKAWVDAGAPAPDEKIPDDPRKHWSYQKPVKVPLPDVANAAWAKHPIDRFLAAEHERRGLTPTETAPKNLLLRRVYLDLIGLPPTAEQLQAYLADESPGAYERVVDQLLASPHYGERWGRHWMDVWRYSDWDGYGAEVRESQPHVWRWRDWTIEALNADRPYDVMVREMLAADELAPLDNSALRATGYLVRNWYKFNRNVWLENTVEHTAKAFLGTTLNCARCHDHMYDPILQTEYYQFRAFFEPHKVRTDRLPGQADTKLDGLARVYDADAAAQTFLFVRGSEAKPDKEHPLTADVPRALNGLPLSVQPVPLPVEASYPGVKPFVVQETLAAAQAEVDRTEPAMAQATAALAEARKKLADFLAAQAQVAAAKPAADGANNPNPAPAAPAGNAAPPASAAPPDEAVLTSAVTAAETAATVAEHEMLTAAAQLVAVRAKIAADQAAFTTPPAANTAALAREASRAERVANVEQAKRNVVSLEAKLQQARATDDDKSKKAVKDLEPKLTEARKAHETAQTALGTPSEAYTRFGEVFPASSTGRRAALARWIASKQNPLTARVAINHIWLRHFGSPLVPTVFDFGLNGKKPTHPELLDWLAVELMDNDWRMKSIHRLIVTSQAYRMQSASTNSENLARDGENVFLWRMNARRMEAEAVRDSTLAVAGSLDATMFGADLDQAQGLAIPRRSIYFRSSKEKKVTFLEMFDSANVTDCYRRSETVVPQQALAMINSSLTLAEARKLATALGSGLPAQPTSADLAKFVDAAFVRVLCREPRGDERIACLEFLTTQSQQLANPAALVAFSSEGENPVKPASDPAARARENLVHVLLNHNDFLTVR